MSRELNATNVKIQSISETEIKVVGEVDGSEKKIALFTQGSLAGINDIRSQKADLAMLSGGGDNLAADMSLTNIALDGIAVICNKTNAIKALKKSQIRDVFLGKITNWVDLGGENATINVHIRDPNQSGIFEGFKQMVAEPTANLPANVHLYSDTKQMLHGIETDPFAIGLSSSSNVGETSVLGLSDEGTAVLYPSPFTIQTEDYIFTRRLYLAHIATNNHPLIKQFLAFCEADDKGQKVIAELGFVNMNLHNADTHTTLGNAPPQYLAATNGAKRLPTTLHFKSGSSMPDERATGDIRRIITLLAEPQNRQKQVVLIGFTDNVGNPTQNLSLSIKRAQSIQAEFAKFGLQSEILGFGQALPVATNTTALGQNKNRRVEAWMK